jgi:MinD-like ATPase involved in chromosome partitioning or flagellar assembly
MRVADLLRASDLFEQLTTDEIQQLAQRLEVRQCHRDEVLCQQGEPAEAMFIIVDGCLQLTSLRPDGRLRMIRHLGDGESFGEIALFSGERHAATVTAVDETRVALLQKDAFEQLVATRPHIMRSVLAAVSKRAARSHRLMAPEQPGEALAGVSGQVYAVFSPRGGVGKTTLTVNLAVWLAGLLRERTALLDLDLVFDDAALLLNLEQPPALAAIAEADMPRFDLPRLAEYAVEHESGVHVVVGATRPEDGERVTEAHVRGVLGTMRRRFLATVVDCGSGVSRPAQAALEAADRVIVVCSPELTTLRDVLNFQRGFGRILQTPRNKALYVINHPGPTGGLSREKFEGALEQTIALEIPYAGEAFARGALSTGQLMRTNTRSPYARAIINLAEQLKPPKAPTTGTREASSRISASASVSASTSRSWNPLQRLFAGGIKSTLLARHG